MDIREMKAGNELNKLIAEKVMGWSYYHRCPDGYEDCLHWHTETGIDKGYKCPDYSGDISAAWKVVEKMRANGNEFYQRSTGNNEWLAQFKFHYGSGYIAKTAPEAICKAALLAMEDK